MQASLDVLFLLKAYIMRQDMAMAEIREECTVNFGKLCKLLPGHGAGYVKDIPDNGKTFGSRWIVL